MNKPKENNRKNHTGREAWEKRKAERNRIKGNHAPTQELRKPPDEEWIDCQMCGRVGSEGCPRCWGTGRQLQEVIE